MPSPKEKARGECLTILLRRYQNANETHPRLFSALRGNKADSETAFPRRFEPDIRTGAFSGSAVTLRKTALEFRSVPAIVFFAFTTSPADFFAVASASLISFLASAAPSLVRLCSFSLRVREARSASEVLMTTSMICFCTASPIRKMFPLPRLWRFQ